MKKIGVAGLQREQIKKTIEATAPGCFEVFIHNDMEAAMKVKSGQLDYYIGACNTGAGAALSIAIAVIGYNKSCTIAKPGIKAKDEHIAGSDSNLLIVFYVQIMPDDLVMQLHRF